MVKAANGPPRSRARPVGATGSPGHRIPATGTPRRILPSAGRCRTRPLTARPRTLPLTAAAAAGDVEVMPRHGARPAAAASAPAAQPKAQPGPPCPICLEPVAPADKPGARVLRSTGIGSTGTCEHIFCKECLGRFCQVGIEQGKANGGTLACPVPGCAHELTTNDLKALVSEATFAKHKEFMFDRKMATTRGYLYCPNPRCRVCLVVKMKGAGAADIVECPECHNEFCRGCSLKPHPKRSCDAALDGAYGQWKKSMGAGVKACPGCKTHIEKNGGCNHVQW